MSTGIFGHSIGLTGLMASSIGLLFSMIVMMIETGHMLFYFRRRLKGRSCIQTTGEDPASWVSAVDMMSLTALSLSFSPNWSC